MAETTTAAAEALTKVQLPSKLAVQASQEDSLTREDARVQRDPLKPDAVPPSKPMLEEGQDPTTAPEAGDKPGDKLVVEIKDSSVWDADVIDIKEPISQLQFDPRSPTGKAEEEVASLEVRKYRCLNTVFEFLRGLIWGTCFSCRTCCLLPCPRPSV